MKRIILVIAVIFIFSLTVSAQYNSSGNKTFNVSVGFNGGIPVGDIADYTSSALGPDIKAEYKAADYYGITLSAGYIKFAGKNSSGSFSAIPVLLGAKRHFSEAFYLSTEVGASFLSDDLGTVFTYGPMLGVIIKKSLDIGIKYQSATKSGAAISFLGIRAAYIF